MPTTTTSPSGRWNASLSSATDEEIARLLQLRPDLIVADPIDVDALATRSTEAASILRFHSDSNFGVQQLMESLCVLGPCSVATLQQRLDCEADTLRPVLDGLVDAWILRLDGDDLKPNPGLAGAISAPCRLGPAAEDLLGRRSDLEIRSIAGVLGLGAKGARSRLIDEIVAALSDRGFLGELLKTAPESAVELLSTTCLEWPYVRFSYPVEYIIRDDRTASGWCMRRGLVVGTGFSDAATPREVAIALRGGRLWTSFHPEAPLLPTTPAHQDAADAASAERALQLIADVQAICEMWSEAPAKPLQSGGIGVREVRKAAKLVDHPEAIAGRLIELASAAGIIGVDRSGSFVAPTSEFDSWVATRREHRWLTLISAWLDSPLHISTAGSFDDDGKPIAPLLRRAPDTRLASRRYALMHLLAGMAEGAACEPDAIAGALVWHRPSLWGPSAPVAAELIGELLSEAQLLGVAHGTTMAGHSRQLLNGRADTASAELSALLPPLVDSLILQADLTVTCPGVPEPELGSEMDLMADVESTGHAVVWRIGEASLRRAFDVGRDADAIIGFLERHAKGNVPQPLVYLVNDVARRHGRVRVGGASCYLRSEDPSLLVEIASTKKLRRLGLRVIAPTVAVSDRVTEEVADALRTGGFLPAVESADGALVVARPVAHRAQVWKPPSPRAAAVVRQVVERQGDGLPDTVAAFDDVLEPVDSDDKRPSHIAHGTPEIRELLELAAGRPWAVRMSYLNTSGNARDFHAQILRLERHKVRVSYVGKPGGGPLEIRRIAWVRVATRAEERELGLS